MSRTDDPMRETWEVRKPTVESAGGLVASQHYAASEVGARVLAEGGNAVDAAVAAGLAIGAVEPWMSGLGGGGFMLIYLREEQRCHAVDFGMRAASTLDPRDYPLVEGEDSDLFHWPRVAGDRNVHGPLSIAVPGHVAGHATALERFGTLSWAQALAPAIELARDGLSVDWYATLKIASEASVLARDAECARIFLPGGHAPAGAWSGAPPRIGLGKLADTLAHLAEAGPRDFYEGDIARTVAADAAALGARVGRDDLADYQARVLTAPSMDYRGARVYAAPGLSAGPTLHHALALLNGRFEGQARPGPDTYRAYVSALLEAYAKRLATLGEAGVPPDEQTCTTHLSVVDSYGNVVALTQTLLSVFGSKVMLADTGILMNNGIMWFDPRPDHPNSMHPGRRPLSNMCPAVAERADGVLFALGASGGRRIMPAVLQLVSFLVDFELGLDAACHQPRVDVSGSDEVTANRALPEEVIAALAEDHSVTTATHAVYPALFACPNVVGHDPRHGVNSGGAFVMSPWAQVAMER